MPLGPTIFLAPALLAAPTTAMPRIAPGGVSVSA
jgi:hypothetical protein